MAKAYSTNGMGQYQGAAPIDQYGMIPFLAWTPKVTNVVVDTTLTMAASGSFISTVGNTEAEIVLTLPAISDGPFIFFIMNATDTTLTLTAETADTVITFNNAAADGVGFATASEKIGGAFMVVCDGTSLWAIPMGAGGHVQTLTVTDA